MPVERYMSGNLCYRRQETSSVRSHWVTICTQDNDHAGDEKFRGCWPSHLEQFTSRSANHNSLPSDVHSTSEGSPVWLIGSTSEDYLWRALQIHSSSSSSITRWYCQWPWVTWGLFRPLEMLVSQYVKIWHFNVTRSPVWASYHNTNQLSLKKLHGALQCGEHAAHK